MIIHNIDQQSEAWFQARCGKVTGTRFKDLMAGETTDTYKKLVSNIACEIITNEMEVAYSNALMEHGIETEPVARKEYESIFETEVQIAGFITRDEGDKYYEWIGISPDGILPDSGILEIKCPLARTHFEYIESNKLPSEYRHQVQGQLFVTGFKYCHFMSFVKGMKPFIVAVEPDLTLFAEYEKRLDLLIIHVHNKLETYHKYDYMT
jgi:putative phage-type endonuclease